jgi:glycolate oxidase FAD binding subunit
MVSGEHPAREDLKKVTRVRLARGPKDAVAGVRASYVTSPASTDEVAEVLRVAGQHDLAVVPRGSGSKLDWGTAPERVDVLLDMSGVSGVVEHAAGDLVVVVRAGTPVHELQDVVGQAGQQLALDSPLADATIGGTLATATSGPRRLLYGTPRDLLIGVTFVRGDGVVAKAGGKVVKNVAGYDFGKLLTGSWGTLGVITEAVFRLHPLPAARRVISATYPDAVTAGQAALAVLGSQVVPTAVELDQPGDDSTRLAAVVEGVADGVDTRAAEVRRLLGREADVAERLPDWFGALPFASGDIGLKVTSALTGVGPTIAEARRLAQQSGTTLTVRGSASGVLYGGIPKGSDPGAVGAILVGLRAEAARHDGTVTMLTAPDEIRSALDPWGPVPGLELMRRLKHEMDPGRRLSPGRFVGGI